MKLGSSPFEWLEFDKAGALKDPAAIGRLGFLLSADGVKDLVILSHGWNNDLADATRLYGDLWKNVSDTLVQRGKDPSHYVVAGLLWPAKRYDANYDGAAEFVDAGATGGVLALDDPANGVAPDIPPERLEQMIAQVAAFADDPDFEKVAQAARKAAAPAANDDGTAIFKFFDLAMKSLGFDAAEQDPELRQDARLFGKAASMDGANALLAGFAAPQGLELAPGVGAAQGLGDIVSGIFSGARNGVVWALNKLTYYTMKKRAGLVGEGLASALRQLVPPRRIDLHLVGHSFGGRAVSAAANAFVVTDNFPLRSLTLLQAAYSHNGMTDGQGPFAKVVGKPTGPISFTHTHNDKACTIAYPLASRLSGDTTQALGDKNDRYGAMGANGPQLAGTMMAADCGTTDFAPVPGKINRFLADSYVVATAQSDAHNNVTNLQCGRLVAATITA